MTDVCREFGISRKTGYKIFDRYKEHGLEALKAICCGALKPAPNEGDHAGWNSCSGLADSPTSTPTPMAAKSRGDDTGAADRE
jgi:hypothetical protein